MSYIAAYHCQTGIVICADTLETIGDEKNYVEKLAIIEDRSYPLAIGGAGVADLIDAATQEITDRAKEQKPKTRKELKALVKASLREVFEIDLPTLVVPKQHRSPEMLIAAKPTEDDFCIFYTKGRRILGEPRRGIIGHPSLYNWDLLKRLHAESLSMQQAVMLATYLVAQSKKLDEGVGGETRIAVVVENGAWIDDPEYIVNSERRVQDFLKLTDELFFACIDVSIPPKIIPDKFSEFIERVNKLREAYLNYSAARTINRMFHEPGYSGDPYQKLFGGATTLVRSDLTVTVTDEPAVPEQVQQLLKEQRETMPTLGSSDTVGELPEPLQAIIAQNSKGVWEMQVTKKESC